MTAPARPYQSKTHIRCARCGEYVLVTNEQFHQDVGCQLVIEHQRNENAQKWEEFKPWQA